jgi:DNA polymerase V
MTVFVQTNRFDTRSAPYAKSITVSLDYPSSDTRDLMAAAMNGLHTIYREGYRYAKAGVILSEFTQPGAFTDDLFAQPKHKNSDALMNVLDFINQKKGRGTVRFCSEPRKPDWAMKQDSLSPAYTTDWDKVAEFRIA